MTAQYRVVVAKNDERVEGADDALVVLSVALDVAAADDFDATVEYMRGRLKAVGRSGAVLSVLKSGQATAALHRLALT